MEVRREVTLGFICPRLKELGGGSMLDIGVYCVQFASFVFGGKRPENIVAAGNLNEDGVDDSSSSTLIYPGGKTATLIVHGSVRMENSAIIVGTRGTIKVGFFSRAFFPMKSFIFAS